MHPNHKPEHFEIKRHCAGHYLYLNLYLFNMNNLLLLFICVIGISIVKSTPARNVPIPLYPQPAGVPQYNQGLQYGDLGCCRSSFPGMK